MVETSQPAAPPLEPGLRFLIELVAERLDAGAGVWTLEFRLCDGKLERFFRHHGPVSAAALAQFEGGGAGGG